MLVNANPKMDELTKIALIIFGLPFSIQEKFDRYDIEDSGELFEKLNALDRPRSFNKTDNKSFSSKPFIGKDYKNFTPSSSSSGSTLKKGPCTYCEKKGHPGRSHNEEDCITKFYDSKYKNNKNGNVTKKTPSNRENKTLNLAELEEFLGDFETKNE